MADVMNFDSKRTLWSFIAFCIFQYSASTALAYLQSGTVKAPSLEGELRAARKMGLTLNGEEIRIKNNLTRLKKNDDKKFKAQLEDTVEKSESYRSYLLEVRDGRSEIDQLKVVAKHQLYKAVQHNWDDLRSTILNEVAAPNWKSFEPYLRHVLEDVEYIPSAKSRSHFTFRVGSWGIVNIDKKGNKISRISWNLDVSSANDGNKLEPGAESITIKQ